jgi:alginate O-acetyltransferase complex protein AlgI
MLFNSLEFAVFFPLVLLTYCLLPRRGQNRMLLIASYVFYGWWDYRFLSLIIISTCLDYLAGLKMDVATNGPNGPDQAKRKLWLSLSLIGNLGILFTFKYFNFFLDSLQALLGSAGLQISPFQFGLVLPVGISFYTFQTLSYTIDIYRGKMRPTDNFWDFALFVAFFPQLVAGPIERAKSLLPQFLVDRRITWPGFVEGLQMMMYGLFIKVFVADSLAPLVDGTFSVSDPPGWSVAFASFAFAFQIYADFSGYSLIARGSAKCLGIDLMRNFDHPYVAASPREFWRRWHISLSTWFRDYFYIALGGNRAGKGRTYFNLSLTMLVCGLWHGAAWTFVAWGAYHGALLIIDRIAVHRLPRLKSPPSWMLPLNWLVTFGLVCYGWLIFRAQSMDQVFSMSAALFKGYAGADWSELGRILLIIAPLVTLEAITLFSGQKEWHRIAWLPHPAKGAVYGVLVYLMLTQGVTNASFIYFQF